MYVQLGWFNAHNRKLGRVLTGTKRVIENVGINQSQICDVCSKHLFCDSSVEHLTL